ncbi:Exocyst complex component 6 [Homalodisca vitripennis]|nr:Exocyst complex component 6 [Homalodisca vitripennis]
MDKLVQLSDPLFETYLFGVNVEAIYDGDEHQKFMEQLDTRIKNHDRDIERMCNFHYQGFIDSIRELLQVRSQAQKLNSEVVEMDEALQKSAAKVMEKSEELVRARKVEKNIAGAIENLSLCLPVLNTYAKLQKQMSEKRYYPALKTLEQLEHHHLPTVANYRFSHQMKESIPKLRDSIKDASMSDLKDFLENIRKFSPKIGEVAMRHKNKVEGTLINYPCILKKFLIKSKKIAVCVVQPVPVGVVKGKSQVTLAGNLTSTFLVKCGWDWCRYLSAKSWESGRPPHKNLGIKRTAEQMGNSDPGIVGRKKKRQAPPPPNPFTGEVAEPTPGLDTEEDLSAQDLIDFSPVYRCLHIYSVLSSRDIFETYYRKQRKKQARLVLQPPTNMHESIEGYRTYIHSVVGFFVVEDHILNTGNGLVNRSYLDEVWGMALSKIMNALRTHSAYCTDANLMLKIKNLIMLFSNTLRNYGYSVNQLSELLAEIRVHYNEVLMKRWVQVFREILDEENFLPIQVPDQAQYDQIVAAFPFQDLALEKSSFPKRFPFSPLVPKVYQQVKEFIYACLKFSEDLNLSQGEVDDMIRKSTNLLLTTSFSGCLSSIFKKPSLALMQIIQILIDTGYLEDATTYLEEFVSNITGSPREGQLGSRGQGHLFRVARDDAERQICDKLKAKLDEFLELEDYDWLLIEPQGHASSFITDLIAFLDSTFQSFTNLPAKVAQEACKSACEHIAKSMLDFLLNEDVKQISTGALQQINLDTIQCERKT